MSSIDLNNPPPNHKFSVSVEREETVGERRVRLFKDIALFVAALAFVMLIAWLCYSTLTSATAGPEAFAVVDIDTLWRSKEGEESHWFGRTGKTYVKTSNGWKMINQVGVFNF